MSLRDRIKRMIEADGPMPVSLYMQLCLHDPQQGYYATRPGLGRDFITAPEISQIFGELIGLWVVHEWQAIGRPSRFTLAEPGAGRATMMQDALRAMSLTSDGRDCLSAINLHLVEPSDHLRPMQAGRLADYQPQFVSHIDALPHQPTIIISNEFLDCLPARQFVRGEKGDWHERKVGLADGELVMGVDREAAVEPPSSLPELDTMEYQPGLGTYALSIAALVETDVPVRALAIDYGLDGLPPDDSLRAFRNGEQIDPLALPGESDLTVDVDFAELRRQGEAAGLHVHGTMAQGQFLLALGAEARMQQLVKANPEKAAEIYDAAARLIDPAQLGVRFKAMCLSSEGLPTPAGF